MDAKIYFFSPYAVFQLQWLQWLWLLNFHLVYVKALLIFSPNDMTCSTSACAYFLLLKISWHTDNYSIKIRCIMIIMSITNYCLVFQYHFVPLHKMIYKITIFALPLDS